MADSELMGDFSGERRLWARISGLEMDENYLYFFELCRHVLEIIW